MRLSKFISSSGYASRRKSDVLIENGFVIVNNEVCRDFSTQINENDEVIVESTKISLPNPKIFSFYKSSRPGLHAFRAISGALAIIALFLGLRELPLADVVSLTFGGPIFVTIASIFFLSERVGIKRWSAVFLGFLGMLLIVQPAFIDVNYYYITPIVFCIFFACVAISVRSLSKTEPNYTIAFYFTLLCTLLGLATIFFTDWIMPTFIDFILFFVLGLCGSVANLLLTQSYRLAEASLVTPIKYLSLVFAIIFGYFIWSEVPKILTLLGASLVIASSLIIFMRENKLKKQIVAPRT